MNRSALQMTALFLCFSAASISAEWGDFKHDYLLPEEREGRFHIFGHFSGSWDVEERDDGDSTGIEWRNSFGDRSHGALWLAGSPSTRISYFAEGIYELDEGAFRANQVRSDFRVFPRALSFRFGRFYFPFGIEMRGASSRVNRFSSRPTNRTRTATGIGVYGDLLLENLNYFLAVANRYPGAIADSLNGLDLSSEGGDENAHKAWGGRLALSPRQGVELGFSYAWEKHGEGHSREATLIGGDFSFDDGPLHVQVEGSRLRRDGSEGEIVSTLFHGRLGFRIIEDSDHFEGIDLLAGADLDDPGGKGIDDRLTSYVGGLAVAPGMGLKFRLEYQARREPGRAERRNDRWFTEILLAW